MKSNTDKSAKHVIESHRPTGPRLTVAEKKSLGELVIHKAKELSETGTKFVITTTKQHKFATTIAASTVLAAASHFIVALLIMSDTIVSGRPYVVGQGSTTFASSSVTSSFTPTCAESTTFLARTSGMPDATKSAVDTAICGLVTDGVITGNMGTTGCGNIIDGLYVYMVDSETNALLNWCGTAHPMVKTGSMNFLAYNGYMNDGTTSSYMKSGITGLNASNCGNGSLTCNLAQPNNGFLAAYDLTSSTAIGHAMGANRDPTVPDFFDLVTVYDATGISGIVGLLARPFSSAGNYRQVANPNGNGFAMAFRTSSTQTIYYHYSGAGTFRLTENSVSSGGVDFEVVVFGANHNGTPEGETVQHRVGAHVIGGGLNFTQAKADALSSRINTLATTVGASYHY